MNRGSKAPGLAVVLFAALAAFGCAPECRFDTDCPDLLVCAGGKCADSESLALAMAGRCDSSSSCASNEECLAGFCRLLDPGNGPDPGVCSVTISSECGEDLCLPSGVVPACAEPPCPASLSCRAATGRARPAGSCLEDADCSTGWCRQGACAAVCLGDGTCPQGFSCVNQVDRPPWGSQDGWLRLCQQESSADIPCDTSALCPDELACVFRYPEDASTRCDAPMGTGASGAACNYGWCQSGICLDVGLDLGRCTEPCLDTLDCEAGMVCGSIYLLGLPGDPQVQSCDAPTEACFTTTDCKFLRDDVACSVRMLLGRDHPVFRCRPHIAEMTGRTGDACAVPDDCTTGLCTPEGVCGQLCDTDWDCRCAYDAFCPDCQVGEPCHLPGWYCGSMVYETSLRSYDIRVCRPP